MSRPAGPTMTRRQGDKFQSPLSRLLPLSRSPLCLLPFSLSLPSLPRTVASRRRRQQRPAPSPPLDPAADFVYDYDCSGFLFVDDFCLWWTRTDVFFRFFDFFFGLQASARIERSRAVLFFCDPYTSNVPILEADTFERTQKSHLRCVGCQIRHLCVVGNWHQKGISLVVPIAFLI